MLLESTGVLPAIVRYILCFGIRLFFVWLAFEFKRFCGDSRRHLASNPSYLRYLSAYKQSYMLSVNYLKALTVLPYVTYILE